MQDQRQPQHRVHPERRLIEDLGEQRRADDDEAGDEHDEDRGPVAGIGEAVIEPADVAARPQRQKALEQLALAATRTCARQSGEDRSGKRVDCLFGITAISSCRASPRKRGRGFSVPPRHRMPAQRGNRAARIADAPRSYSGTGTPAPHT